MMWGPLKILLKDDTHDSLCPVFCKQSPLRGVNGKEKSYMRQVQKITVNNKGGYVFNFSVDWLGSDGHWHRTEWNSGDYPVAQSRTTPPLETIGVPADALAVTPYGHALAGSSAQGTPFVSFAANGQIATYDAVGTTIIGFAINLIE
jgi:hypothetical protein